MLRRQGTGGQYAKTSLGRELKINNPVIDLVSFTRWHLVKAIENIELFRPADQTFLLDNQPLLQGIVDDGPGAFGSSDEGAALFLAAKLVEAFEDLQCDGFILPIPVPAAGGAGRLALASILVVGGSIARHRWRKA